MGVSTFEALRDFFEAIEQFGCVLRKYARKTEVGYFQPSQLDPIHRGIQLLVDEGIVDTSKLFLDAGGGDGRIVDLTSAVFGIRSVAVEYNLELAMFAQDCLEELKIKKIMNGTVPLILNGNFTDDEVYKRAGLMFEDFGTIFNYINNENQISEKIVRQSPKGTLFVLYGSYGREIEGLRFAHTINVYSRESIAGCKLLQPTMTKLPGLFLHVYVK